MEHIFIIFVDYFYLNILDFYVYSFLEDIFIICMVYNFLKLLILGLLSEMVWPTQFFNRRNFIGTSNIHKRVYTEYFTKFYRINNLYYFILSLYMGLCL